MEKPILQDSPSFVDLCTLHQHAMRYYRLWIYACNTVLAFATLIFSVFAVSVLVDPRLSLLSGVELYQPTFLYAYVALLLQCGVLQAIGCIGALRLNQRLLNTYWSLLLILMIGDCIVGLVWAFRLDQIKSNLKPMLRKKFINLYGKDEHFTNVWNWVQSNDSCCGVDGPSDFLNLSGSDWGPVDLNGLANDTWSSYNLSLQQDRLRLGQQDLFPRLPGTCCIFSVTPVFTTEAESQSGGSSVGWVDRGGGSSTESRRTPQKTLISGNSKGEGRWNDVMSRKPISGFYHEEPQQLKGMYYAGNLDNLDPPEESSIYNPLKLNESNDSAERNIINYSTTNSAFMSNKLVVSDLRQQPFVTDQYPQVGTPMGYYAGSIPPLPNPPSGSATHNRRKAKDFDRNNRYNQYGGVKVFTTSSPPPAKPSPATIGVCVLPTHLQETASLMSSSRQDTEGNNGVGGGGASQEEGVEVTTHNILPSSTMTSSSPPAHTTSSTVTESPTSTRSSTTRETGPQSPSSTTTSVPFSQSGSGDVVDGFREQHEQRHHRKRHPQRFIVSTEQHSDGCGDKVLDWLEHSSDVLLVIGFCIIVFVKGCFIAILKYEIKEMIEKIKLLNGEEGGASQAMNELIGLSSIYETANDDVGETEGLMSDAHNNNQDTSYSNNDTVGGGGNNGSGNGLSVSSTTIRNSGEEEIQGRKDSKANPAIGNKTMPSLLGQSGSGTRQIGNHIGYVYKNKNEIEDDFDSGSALLGDSKHPFGESPPLIDINKHSPQLFHRDETRDSGVVVGGGGFPKNGNNNNSSNISSTCAPANRTSFDDVRVAISSPIILHPNNANTRSTSSH